MSSFADIFLDMMRDMQSMIRGCGVSRGDSGVSLSAENDTVSFSLSGQDARRKTHSTPRGLVIR
jgi:hypothetical protein